MSTIWWLQISPTPHAHFGIAELGPDDLSMRAIAHRVGMKSVPPVGLLFLVAADVQMCQTAR